MRLIIGNLNISLAEKVFAGLKRNAFVQKGVSTLAHLGISKEEITEKMNEVYSTLYGEDDLRNTRKEKKTSWQGERQEE